MQYWCLGKPLESEPFLQWLGLLQLPVSRPQTLLSSFILQIQPLSRMTEMASPSQMPLMPQKKIFSVCISFLYFFSKTTGQMHTTWTRITECGWVCSIFCWIAARKNWESQCLRWRGPWIFLLLHSRVWKVDVTAVLKFFSSLET